MNQRRQSYEILLNQDRGKRRIFRGEREKKTGMKEYFVLAAISNILNGPQTRIMGLARVSVRGGDERGGGMKLSLNFPRHFFVKNG